MTSPTSSIMDKESLVSLWVCLLLAAVLLLLRCALRKVRLQSFTNGDYWCMIATFFIVGRLFANHFLLVYGSTRTLTDANRLKYLTDDYAERRVRVTIGSKLVLCTRSLLICILWSLKAAILDLLSRLVSKMSYERKIMVTCWAILGLTFIASITTVFTSCRPFSLYWQIYPDPGNCIIGNLWLYTYEISNVITDILLMLVPFFLIISAKIPVAQRWRILPLFSIGIFLVTISILRIVQGIGSQVQSAHTLWASLEVLFAAIVTVTPTIYALSRNRHEHSSYNRTHTMMTTAERTATYRRSTAASQDIYSARAWVELEDGSTRGDNTSAEGILVETRRETISTKA